MPRGRCISALTERFSRESPNGDFAREDGSITIEAPEAQVQAICISSLQFILKQLKSSIWALSGSLNINNLLMFKAKSGA